MLEELLAMSLKQHNIDQLALLREVQENERWLLGEKLGYDPVSTEYGQRMLRGIVANMVHDCLGKLWAELETVEQIED